MGFHLLRYVIYEFMELQPNHILRESMIQILWRCVSCIRLSHTRLLQGSIGGRQILKIVDKIHYMGPREVVWTTSPYHTHNSIYYQYHYIQQGKVNEHTSMHES